MSDLIPIKLAEMACENLQKEIDALSIRVSELQADKEHLEKRLNALSQFEILLDNPINK